MIIATNTRRRILYYGLLDFIEILSFDTDITCENTQHKQKIDKICVSSIDFCIDCSKLTIPMAKLMLEL